MLGGGICGGKSDGGGGGLGEGGGGGWLGEGGGSGSACGSSIGMPGGGEGGGGEGSGGEGDGEGEGGGGEGSGGEGVDEGGSEGGGIGGKMDSGSSTVSVSRFRPRSVVTAEATASGDRLPSVSALASSGPPNAVTETCALAVMKLPPCTLTFSAFS